MQGFKITTPLKVEIKFAFYLNQAPHTCAAFKTLLPFTKTFKHARISGEEFWLDKAHTLNIIQENASVFVEPGEVVLGSNLTQRNKTAGCIGIYYGEGKGLDASNIFAKVIDEDLPKLKALGESIWLQGEQELMFSEW